MHTPAPIELMNVCLLRDDANRMLVQDRTDPSWPVLCFPGGHVEIGETCADAVVREMQEETGLTVENPTLCGVKQFPAKGNTRYVVFFYKADRYTGDLQSSDEGEVFWLPRQQLSEYHLVEDFMDMLKVFESDTLNEFQYYQEDNGEWGLRLL